MEVDEGEHVEIGDILGKSTRITIKQRDITGGLPRVQDLFEAREPKDKALISFITGRVTIGDLTKSGRVIFVTAETGEGEMRYKRSICSTWQAYYCASRRLGREWRRTDGALDLTIY